MYKLFKLVSLVIICSLSLTSCATPQEVLTAKPPAKDAVRLVQLTVDQFLDEQGVLPIYTADANTPVYEKYRVNFEQLLQMNYISSIPDAAYEKGGSYYFLIVNENVKPVVKLLDLTLYQKLNDVQRDIETYSASRGGKFPQGNEVYPGLYYVDFKKLGKSQPTITSMFTGQLLEPIIDTQGNVYVDYALDLAITIDKVGAKPSVDADLREVLVDNSDFVPVKSLVYRYVNNEPVPLAP